MVGLETSARSIENCAVSVDAEAAVELDACCGPVRPEGERSSEPSSEAQAAARLEAAVFGCGKDREVSWASEALAFCWRLEERERATEERRRRASEVSG
jgi:hypothetical protein